MVWKTLEGTGICSMTGTIDNNSCEDIWVAIAGHVDHGKSTVIGRLLADAGSLPEGKLEQIRERCRRTARPFEYAFLLDALKDEQAQGVTIDSARCFFKTKRRNYILIDTPGHTEFIKNMVSGASRAEAALLVIDAAEGVQDNSKRHGLYLSLLGIKQVCILINKMDLVNYSQERFDEVARSYADFMRQIHLKPLSFIPVSGLHGDNIASHSPNMTWYAGKTVLETLESFKKETQPAGPFRMPVQDIYKFTEEGDQRRIIAGTVESGTLQVGDEVVFYPSRKSSRVKSIEGFNQEKQYYVTAGYAAGFTLEDQIYIKRGELAVKSGEEEPHTGRRIKTVLFWLGKQPVSENNKYLFKIGGAKTSVKVERIIRVLDAATGDFIVKDHIERHEIAECILALDKDIAFDTANEFAAAGRFAIVDEYNISGGGMILKALTAQEDSLPKNLYSTSGKVSYEERCRILGQKGAVLWFTGLSGAGKSTIAIELERELMDRGRLAYRLDGDNIRDGLNSDLGFSIEDRDENIRRVSEAARLFKDSGMITLVALISPLRSMREKAKCIVGNGAFAEIYVKASLETCISRDTKGLYAKALEGKIKNFTGISSRYEEADCPDLILDTEKNNVSDCVAMILDYLETHFQMKVI